MLQELEKRTGYSFRNKALLKQAMTHTSYSNEHGGSRLTSNERLEFLGDAVLELVSSEYIYAGNPGMNEGEMTRLRASIVCEAPLAEVAVTLGIPQALLLGKGEEAGGGRKRNSLTSDALEALIGAIYLDGGIDPARKFVRKFIMSGLENRKLFSDTKTILQEKTQEAGGGEPVYALISESGPDHRKVFRVAVYIGDVLLAEAEGSSKKQAEQKAAEAALKKISH